MPLTGHDTLKARRTLAVGSQRYDYFSLEAAAKAGIGDIKQLPYSLKVLLENLLRWEDGRTVTVDDVKSCIRTRAGRYAISRSERRSLSQAATAFTSSTVTVRPSSQRSRFSSSTLSE